MATWFRRVTPDRSDRRRESRTGLRPRVERLEDRSVPATLVGLTSANALVTFDSATPGAIQSTVTVTGLQPLESLLAIDFRPANGQLFGLGSTSRVYVIDPTTGAATAVNGPFSPALSGTQFGFDFNPAVDKLRVVSDFDQNLRVNPITGTATTDVNLAYDPTNFNAFFGTAPPSPQVVATAYTKNADPVSGKTVTTLYAIDANLDVLVTQGGAEGDPSPNGGLLFVVDRLGFDAQGPTGFDIETATDKAFVVSAAAGGGSQLLSVNLTTGAATAVGAVGGGATLIGLAVAAPAAGSGTLSLPAGSLAFGTDRAPLAVTVTRTGGTTGTVTVDFATADGTAVAGVDYAPTSGTLTFGPGQTTQTIFLVLPSGDPVAGTPERAFNLTLSNPTGGAALGATTTATVTIPAVASTPGDPPPGNTPAPVPSRFFAVGGGEGRGPQVIVYDSITRQQVGSFFAYEPEFTGGVTVAAGDVNGDGFDDLLVGSGVGGAPRVRVFDGATLSASAPTVLADFFAYESSFRGGVNVATGDVNGDGFQDLLIGSGVGGGPRVRVLDGVTLTSEAQVTIADFFAYEDTFRGGVNVGSGEFNGDGFADILAGAGFGGAPRVRVLDGPTRATLADYFAYESSFRNGVLVSSGDVDGDGVIEVLAGAGPGGGPRVRALRGATEVTVSDFFAYEPEARGGVRVTAADLMADGVEEIITGPGPGGGPRVRVLTAAGAEVASFFAFEVDFVGGVFVG